MKDERDQNREACPENLLQQVAVELRPAVSELYSGLWRIALGRELRSDEEDKQLLASVNAAANTLGCAGFSSMGAAIFISNALAMHRRKLEPPSCSSGDLNATERQERAVQLFACVDMELSELWESCRSYSPVLMPNQNSMPSTKRVKNLATGRPQA